MGKNIHVVSMDVEVTAVIRKDIIMLARKGNGRIIVIHSFVLFDKMADYISNLLKFCSAILSLHFQIVFSSSFDLLFIQPNISAVLSIKAGSSTGAMLSVSTIIFFQVTI